MEANETHMGDDMVVSPTWNPGPPFMTWRRQPMAPRSKRRLMSIASATAARLARRLAERQQLKALASLDDRLLDDLGLTRSDLRRRHRLLR
jgi:uncharacterized protein YjiS (DUF1127 family)